MSPKGCEELELSLEEVTSLSIEDYHERFFNPEDAAQYIPKIKDLLQRNTYETFTFFQQVRVNQNPDWKWYISSVKILLRDEKKDPLVSQRQLQKLTGGILCKSSKLIHFMRYLSMQGRLI